MVVNIAKHFLQPLRTKYSLELLKNQKGNARSLSYIPKLYDGVSPEPVFIRPEIQTLLRTLTRVDLEKVYKRRKLGQKRLEQPVYKFMTAEELERALDEVKKRVDYYLQIPPVVTVRPEINRVLSHDPNLQGYDDCKYVFTDITFGVKEHARIVLVRDTDGTLKDADWDTRQRINQMYFPQKTRSLSTPKMFEDEHLKGVLHRQDYVFVLDRACAQFEPDDPHFQKIVTITYQHINDSRQFEKLRSTRHFGGLAFFLAWNKMIDNLLLELIETEHIEEGKALISLYCEVHKVEVKGDDDLAMIGYYIKEFSGTRGVLELALQSYANAARQREELEAGIRTAHGL